MQPSPDSIAVILPPLERGHVRVLVSGAVYDVPSKSLKAAQAAEPSLVVMSIAPPRN